MAKTYLDIQNSAYTVGNIMDWTNALTRLSGVPVDITEVYDSYDKAVEYAATNPVAYEGQLITVTENGDTTVYVITPAVQGTHIVGEGDEAVTYNVNIKKVGTVPSGDNASITVTEAGLVSIFGFAGAQDGMLPVRENGVLTWKTLEAIGAGDGNDNTTYEFALTDAKTGIIVTPLFNGQPIMEGEEGAQTQKKFELVLDVYTKGEADEKFLAKADYTPYDDTALAGRVKAIEDDYLKTEDKYDDTDVKGRLDVIEGDYLKAADRYDDTELAGRVSAIEGDYLKEADKYDDTALTARVKAIEDDYLTEADKYDDTALAGRVSTLETASADHETRITDHETRIGKVEEFFKTADGESLAEAMDTLIEIQKEIASDNEGAAAMLSSIEANTAAITKLNGDATTEGSVDKKIADAVAPLATTEALNGVKATADAAAVKADVDTELAKKVDKDSYESDKATFAVKSDVEGALALKADADKVVSNDTFEQFKTENAQAIADARTGAVTDVEAKGYAVATDVVRDYATKQELTDHSNTMATTLNDYAKKADVEADLAKKIETGTIAHSTDELAEGVTVTGTNLNIVVDTFTKAETRQYVADTIKTMTGGESAADVKLLLENHIADYEEKVGQIDTKNGEQDTAIATAQTQADKGVADAKAANDAITALTNGAVATNTTDIGAIKTRLDTLETAKGNHEQRISTAEGNITSLLAADEAINGSLGTINGNITALQNKDSELAGLITALQTNKADASSVYTKSDVDGFISTLTEGKADKATTYTKDEVDGLLANLDQTEILNAIAANTSAISTLVGEDEGQSVRAIAADEINTLINAADPEGGKVISDIANLVKYVEENAGEIASLVTATNANTAKLEGITTTVVDYVTTAIGAIVMPKASDEITIAEDGTLGVGKVNVNKLVQTEGETLVLNGGNA